MRWTRNPCGSSFRSRFGDLVAGVGLERLLVAGVFDLLVGRDRPNHAVAGQHQQPAVLGLDQQLGRSLPSSCRRGETSLDRPPMPARPVRDISRGRKTKGEGGRGKGGMTSPASLCRAKQTSVEQPTAASRLSLHCTCSICYRLISYSSRASLIPAHSMRSLPRLLYLAAGNLSPTISQPPYFDTFLPSIHLGGIRCRWYSPGLLSVWRIPMS